MARSLPRVPTTPRAFPITEIFSLIRTICESATEFIRSAWESGSSGLQDNEDSASRQLGQATFASLTTFLQGTIGNTPFQVVPLHTELGWRSLFGAWYIEDSIKVRRNLTLEAGLRQEFTTGWNEAYGRAANYVTNAQGVLETAPHRGQFRVYRE